uniref:Uncharacterized protein n=1 Tax=Setaria italica TaxID=4555 RepID=K4AH07_SETIT
MVPWKIPPRASRYYSEQLAGEASGATRLEPDPVRSLKGKAIGFRIPHHRWPPLPSPCRRTARIAGDVQVGGGKVCYGLWGSPRLQTKPVPVLRFWGALANPSRG